MSFILDDSLFSELATSNFGEGVGMASRKKVSQRCVMLLRAINVGKRQLPMVALREMATSLGFGDATTYVASGNLVVTVDEPPEVAARRLETKITEHFGFHTDVIVRTSAQWSKHLEANPFLKETAAEPNRVMLMVANRRPAAGAAALLSARAGSGERIEVVGDAAWVHFPNGLGVSKLTPAVIDKAIGAPTTTRNVRTARAIAELLTPPAIRSG